MPQYEYKVVPAPVKGTKTKGLKGTRERFAHTLMTLMNELGREGWEYLRADSLPCEERQGLTGKSTSFQNLLIFRREIPAAPAQEAPSTPEEIAASAAASLRAETEEGNAPAVERGSEGAAPGVGPASPSDEPGRRDGMAAE